MDFPAYGFLHAFTRFQKPGERGVIALGPSRLPTDKRLALMFSQHDDNGVGAGEMFLVAAPAFAAPSSPKRLGFSAALAAEAMAIVPVNQAAGGAVDRRFFRRQCRQRKPHSRRPRRTALGFHNGHKMRFVLMQAKQDQFEIERDIGHALPDQSPFSRHHGIQPVQPEHAPAPVVEQAVKRLQILPYVINAVEGRACKSWIWHQLARLA